MFKLNTSSSLAPSRQHAPSYYAATLGETVTGERLDGTIQAEVCVIGGGFTGLAAALHLARAGRSVVLLEQSLLGWGASGRNGGQVHVGLRRDQDWLEAKVGVPAARRLWQLALDGRAHLDWLMGTYGIDCDFRDGYLHADHKASYVQHTRDYVQKLRDEYDYSSVRFVDREEISALVDTATYFGGSLDTRGGHLHPLKLAIGMARAAQSHGARLFEDAEVTSLERRTDAWEARTRTGIVRADKVVLACNGYLRGLSDDVAAHVMPINNFVAVTETLGEERAASLIRGGLAVSDSRFVVHYYRMTKEHRLLFGGGENYGYRFPRDIGEFVRPHVLGVFPQLAGVRFDFAWGGTLSITPTRMPYLREVAPGCFNASGFSGLGVVLAPYAGKIIAEALGGGPDAFQAFAGVPVPKFPGGPALRWPTLVAAMSYYALRDRL
jgi:gamma-glutamylputrescine oxidase